jgi:Domain of unknown function (DUF6265)
MPVAACRRDACVRFRAFGRAALMTWLCLALAACASTPMPEPDVERLVSEDDALGFCSFMAGSWIARSASSDGIVQSSEEHWTHAAGGTMLGMNRLIVGGRTVFFENLRIESRPEGIFYLASPRGRSPATAFRLVMREPLKVVFENPEHDYPQRISYWMNAEGQLHARVEGLQGGKAMAEDYLWERARIVGDEH